MARPRTRRLVRPGIQRCVFRPAGRRARGLPFVALGFDEIEAVRLADLEGLYQEEAARRMGISRQTFGRIVESARRGIADAIINRKCLRIGETEGDTNGSHRRERREDRGREARQAGKPRGPGGVHPGV